jgi:hypothetical protein
MKIEYLIILFTFSFLIGCSSKKDFNQYLAGQNKDHEFIKESTKDFVNVTEFINGSDQSILENSPIDSTGKVPNLPGGSKGASLLTPSKKQTNQYPAGVLKVDDKYLIHDNSKTVYELRNSGNYTFGLIYFNDSYSYVDPTSNFIRTYEQSTGSIKGGFLQLQFEKFLSRKYIDFTVGMNIGLGYNNGRGIFLDGNSTESETKFNLWSLPLDFSIAIDIPISSWVKVTAYGGPSVMGIIQSRDDREQEDDDKIIRQMSFGYFYGAKLRFSLTNLFKKKAIKLYDQFEITRYFLTIDSRIHEYSEFKDNLSISGASFGVGFTFEYL